MSEESSKEKARWDELIGACLDDRATPEEVAELEVALRDHEEVRLRYLRLARTDSLLSEIAAGSELRPMPAPRVLPASDRKVARPLIAAAMAASVLVFAGILVLNNLSNYSPPVAKILEDDGGEWISSRLAIGSKLRPGARIEIAEGEVSIRFESSAIAQLRGPALFEIESANSGVLHHGEVYSTVESPAAKGFTIRTAAGEFIDLGTEFLTTATVDGHSEVQVFEGKVEAMTKDGDRKFLSQGDGWGLSPDRGPVSIRIEAGEDTPEFRFPSIPAPSAEDFADQQLGRARADWWRPDKSEKGAYLGARTGPPGVLLDGKGQANPSDFRHSFFFQRDIPEGLILLDLGEVVPVSRVHTYSWNQGTQSRDRATQRYVLWGCKDSLPSASPSEDDHAGWTRIARVDTDAFFQKQARSVRPAQQASAIFSYGGSLGEFRYLLVQAFPTLVPDTPSFHSLYGEIDVFTEDGTD